MLTMYHPPQPSSTREPHGTETPCWSTLSWSTPVVPIIMHECHDCCPGTNCWLCPALHLLLLRLRRAVLYDKMVIDCAAFVDVYTGDLGCHFGTHDITLESLWFAPQMKSILQKILACLTAPQLTLKIALCVHSGSVHRPEGCAWLL